MRAGTGTVVAAAVIALCLGGCGEDEPKGPSKDEYVKRVDAICVDSSAELRDITEFNIQGRKVDAFEAQGFAEQIAQAMDAMVVQMRQLEKPEDDVPEVERVIRGYENFASEAEKAGRSGKQALAFLANIKPRIDEIDAASREAKTPACDI